jgi:shikimate dehydrogenase
MGYPVAHSFSPAMQNAAFAALGLDYCYVPFPVKPEALAVALKAIRALNIRGVNVTVPHKEGVAAHLDAVTPEARDIGAVNTICNDGGTLLGHNTDAAGFMGALAEEGVDARGMKVLIVGAGGAARAVAYPLCRETSAVYIYNRSRERAEALRDHLVRVGREVRVAAADQMTSVGLRDFDLVINATPLGLKHDDPLPFDPSRLTGRQRVCDLIYRETRLLREARLAGCMTMDGLGMLLWQGAYAFELWTGVRAPVDVMRSALREARGAAGETPR